MRMLRPSGITLALWLLVVSGWSAPAGAAEQRRLVLDYVVYVGGWETVKISFVAKLKPDAYDLTMALNGEGVLDWWFKLRLDAFSRGRVKDGDIIPERAGADSSWNGKQRQTRLLYSASGPPKVELTPPPKSDDRDPVPVELQRGTRDLAGAAFAMLTNIERRGGCDLREPVFDGRRRYDLRLAQLGQETMAPSDYSPYTGQADRCSFRIDRIAGYRKKNSPSKWRKPDFATLWVGKVFDGVPPLPIRAQIDTVVGGLVTHLVNAKLSAGGEIRQLSRVPTP